MRPWLQAAWALPVLFAAATGSAREGRVLDDFRSLDAWEALASDQVKAKLRQDDGPSGKALCLDYDFGGVSGYAVARRRLPMRHPAHFEYAFSLRGDAPLNNFEIKLADASGDNVWWVSRPNWPIPREWTPVRMKERHFDFAWGPTQDKTLRDTRTFELTISAGREGGRGSVCLADLRFRERAAPSTVPPPLRADAPTGDAAAAVDGDADSAWRLPAGETAPLTVDLGELREFGGLVLRWLPGRHPARYHVALSDDRRVWRRVRTVEGNGGADPLALPESEARWLRIEPEPAGQGALALAEVELRGLDFAATPNQFIAHLAAEAPRGHFPRGFSGEQPYWTLVGVDGGLEQGLIGEDGAIEVARGGFSLEPQVQVDGNWLAWPDVSASQSLQDGYLPIPTVRWRHAAFSLEITAFAHGTPGRSQLLATYRLANIGDRTRIYRLALAVQPFQVNGPRQFLSTPGGVSPIRALAISRDRVVVDGRERVFALAPADAAFASRFDTGMAAERLRSGPLPTVTEVRDDTGLASGAWIHTIELKPGESREIAWMAPLTGELPAGSVDPATVRAEVAAVWRGKLNHARFRVPAAGEHIVDNLRTALAHMLVSRVGPRLQPGTRSYARAWIRDGAMIGEGLLRLGREDVAEQFLRWYAPYQFESGKVPCCVDDRGADPVPENDSHGQLVYSVAELYRYTGDRALLEHFWPNVQAAVRYMDRLRLSERTEANRDRDPAFYGMMPASISHEGYSAKPMHSYWDNFWALRGYKDSVRIAQWLGKTDQALEFAASRDQFRADLYASLRAATARHGIDYLPGAAELGDFDATSTTIALSPGGEQARLPQDLLHNTFERYWRNFQVRRDGRQDWDFYTPYELRTVGTFVRLGWRDRAHEALDFFFAGQAPRGWNQWAEVVSRTPREPFFLGDLPHAWVGSDYVRSALDLFAYEREDALVLAAGIPADWLDGEGVAVSGLRTPHGPLAYEFRREGDTVRFRREAGAAPPGGLLLSWPYGTAPGATWVNGQPASWRNGELRLPDGPATAEIRLR